MDSSTSKTLVYQQPPSRPSEHSTSCWNWIGHQRAESLWSRMPTGVALGSPDRTLPPSPLPTRPLDSHRGELAESSNRPGASDPVGKAPPRACRVRRPCTSATVARWSRGRRGPIGDAKVDLLPFSVRTGRSRDEHRRRDHAVVLRIFPMRLPGLWCG